MNGKLIVIEGTDSSGKNTQAKLLTEAMSKTHSTTMVSFPQYGKYSAQPLEAYLAGKFGSDPELVNAYAGSLLYSIDRFCSYRDRTEPDSWGDYYDHNGIVVADRYTTSNIVHQMEKLAKSDKAAKDFIKWLYDIEYTKMGIPRPDTVIFLNMPTNVAKALNDARTAQSGGTHKSGSKTDIHEKDYAYMERCRQSGLRAAKLDGWKVIDCAVDGKPLSIEKIHNLIMSHVKTIIN